MLLIHTCVGASIEVTYSLRIYSTYGNQKCLRSLVQLSKILSHLSFSTFQVQGDMMNMDRTMEDGRSTGYSIMDSADGGVKKRRFTHYSIQQSVNQSLRKLRSASMSVSMLAKPSDDRKASAFLAGWNVSNLIQGTGILGVPYAIRLGGWAGVVACFVIAFLCCHTGKLLVSCMYETSKKTGIKRRLRVNYPEVAEAVWKRHGFTIVSIVSLLCIIVHIYRD